MRGAQHLKGDVFDLKHSVGGIIDVEFLVQYLVLLHAPKYPQLTEQYWQYWLSPTAHREAETAKAHRG